MAGQVRTVQNGAVRTVRNGAVVGKVYVELEPATWPEKMLNSYVAINAPYVTYTQVEKDTILGRLSTAYIISTFGPAGQNKTICDFMMIFWNSNTTTALTTKTNTKTGATLRWNYGNGHIYSQNNLPAQVNSGVISLTSTDAFSGYTTMDLSANTFRYKFPIGSLPSGLSIVYLHTNQFTGDWANKTLSSVITQLYLYSNQFTGGIPNVTPHITNVFNFRAYSPNNFSSASNVTIFRRAMTFFNIQSNALPTAKVDELLHNMNLYYTANVPTQNCTIDLSGATMGIPTGGASNTDLVALQAIWTAAGKTLTITVRTS